MWPPELRLEMECKFEVNWVESLSRPELALSFLLNNWRGLDSAGCVGSTAGGCVEKLVWFEAKFAI